jgi:hypothetical protein
VNTWLVRQLEEEDRVYLKHWVLQCAIPGFPEMIEFWTYPTRFVLHWRVYAGFPRRLVCRGEWNQLRVQTSGSAEVAKAMKSVLERVQLARAGVTLGMGTAGPADLAMFPCLCEMLTSGIYPGGDVREVSRLSLYADQENGGWRAMLTEPSQALVLWTHSEELSKLLQAVEAHVASDKPDWRNDRYATKRGGKKGKG